MVQLSKNRLRAQNRPASPRQAARVKRPIDGLLNAELFKALSDETRLRLLACLAKCGRACTVGEVAACCAVDLSVVSRHLAALKRAGVLESGRNGRTVSYRVRYAGFTQALRALADAVDACRPVGGACCDPKGGADGCSCCRPD